MISLPIKYLKALRLAVGFVRQSKAVNANTFKAVSIGSEEDAKIYEMLKTLESNLDELLLEARNEKAKEFSIVLGHCNFVVSRVYDQFDDGNGNKFTVNGDGISRNE